MCIAFFRGLIRITPLWFLIAAMRSLSRPRVGGMALLVGKRMARDRPNERRAGPALKGGGEPAAVFSGPLLGNRWSFGRMERGLLLLSCAPAETPDQFRLVCVSLGSDYSQYICGSWQHSS